MNWKGLLVILAVVAIYDAVVSRVAAVRTIIRGA